MLYSADKEELNKILLNTTGSDCESLILSIK